MPRIASRPSTVNRDPLLAACGVAIRRLREQRSVSQEAFAKQVGVHRTYMGMLERGKTNPSLKVLAKVADGLGVLAVRTENRDET